MAEMYNAGMTSRPHTIRIPDELWTAATKAARGVSAANNVNFTTTSLVIDAMRSYLQIPSTTMAKMVDSASTTGTFRAEGPWTIEEGKGPDTGSAPAPVAVKPKDPTLSGGAEAKRPKYTPQELAEIDAERLARMKKK